MIIKIQKQLKCKLCEYKWKQRTEKKPVQCPRCKRYDWDKEKLKLK